MVILAKEDLYDFAWGIARNFEWKMQVKQLNSTVKSSPGTSSSTKLEPSNCIYSQLRFISNDDDLLSLPNSSDLTAQSGFPSEGPHFDQVSEEKSIGPEALEPRSQYPEDELSAEKRSSRLEGAKVFERADRFKELASSFRSCFCWTSKSGKLLSSSVGMSRACNEDRKRLDWRLLPGRCKVGTFC
nr:hypothetical protein Iba_chr04bCG9500 [Ipomoea batatas]